MNYGYGAAAPVSETTIFQGKDAQGFDILVTNIRFVSGARTFPMSGITSVSSRVTPAARGWAGLFFILAALSILSLIMTAVGGEFSIAAVFWAAVWGALGYWRWRANPPLFHVIVSTAGTNVDAITSPDMSLIAGVTAALNQAIVMRG